MLPQSIIEKLAQDQKIAPLNIIREHLEMEILYYLSQTKLSENLVFYGGTALRLAYHSFRFSEDLDFLLIKKTSSDKKELQQALESVVADNPGVKIEEIINKRQTLFGLLHIQHELLKHPIRIKIEICKKHNDLQVENTLLVSPASNKEIIFPTANLMSIFSAKSQAIKNRQTARDWFDYWYLNQKLKLEQKINKKFPFNKKEFSNELKRWLPQDKWKIIETAIKFYEKN